MYIYKFFAIKDEEKLFMYVLRFIKDEDKTFYVMYVITL